MRGRLRHEVIFVSTIDIRGQTEQEQQEIICYIEADKPLPDKYRFLLFEKKCEVELVWNGKSVEVYAEACKVNRP